jgi:hypothetical protein
MLAERANDQGIQKGLWRVSKLYWRCKYGQSAITDLYRTFFKPANLRPSLSSPADWFSKVKSAFEEFWDTEKPRLGEEGANGWANSNDTTTPTPIINGDLPDIPADPFRRWLQAERHAEKTSSMPARATNLDSAEEDDPYRVILFSDISPFLVPIQDPEVRLQLIYAFLNFIGLPFNPPEVSTSSPASLDPHLRWVIGQDDNILNQFWPARPSTRRLPWQTVGGEAMEPEQTRGPSSPFASPVKSWAQDRRTTMGPSGRWFQDIQLNALGTVNLTLAR